MPKPPQAGVEKANALTLNPELNTPPFLNW